MYNAHLALTENIALRLYEPIISSLSKSSPKLNARAKSDLALTIVSSLACLSVPNLAKFNNAIVDFIALPKQNKEDVLSRICVKITEMKF